MKTLRHLATVTTLFFAAALSALGHNVWLEDTAEGALVVRFAEYGEEYEKSPGRLDGIARPAAWSPEAEDKVKAIETQKKADHFLLVGASPMAGAQIETSFEVMGKAGDAAKPARKPMFYARWHVAGSPAPKPALNFDLVPTGKDGEVKVYFRGKPLPAQKVTLHPPGADEQELVSDAEGIVRFTTEKKGLYMLSSAGQREATPGFAGGLAYDLLSHNTSLAWRQP